FRRNALADKAGAPSLHRGDAAVSNAQPLRGPLAGLRILELRMKPAISAASSSATSERMWSRSNPPAASSAGASAMRSWAKSNPTSSMSLEWSVLYLVQSERRMFHFEIHRAVTQLSKVYVTFLDNVSVINAEMNHQDVIFDGGLRPVGVAVSPDGSKY